MDVRCFVRVLPQDGVPGGTGYLISRDRVLTAAHVVGSAETVAIEHDVEKRLVRLAADVHWRGDEACDIALLILPQPSELDVLLPRLAETPIDTLTPWESRGWAQVSDDEPLVCDSMVGLHGDAHAFVAHQKWLQLTNVVRAREAEDWKGISGAPVFERGGGRRLLGVVAEKPLDFENVLQATPLSVALCRERFLEKLGAELARSRRDRLIADVKRILGNSPELAAEIAARNEKWRAKLGHGNIDAFIDKLLGATDVVAVLLALNVVHSACCREEDGTVKARAVEEVVTLLAPLLVQRGVLHALPDKSGGVMLRLPVSTKTVAELAVAGFDGRPSALKSVQDDFPVGVGRLPLPVAEEGFDIKAQDTVQAYAAIFEKKGLLSSAVRRKVAWLRSSGAADKALDLVFDSIDGELGFQADNPDRPLRHYLLYDETFAHDKAGFLREIRRRLRQIHMVEHVGQDLLREEQISRPLRDILARASAMTERR